MILSQTSYPNKFMNYNVIVNNIDYAQATDADSGT